MTSTSSRPSWQRTAFGDECGTGGRRQTLLGPRAGVFRRFPDVHFGEPGDRGLSEWLFTATASGQKIEVTGCDVFTFKGDNIAVKNSYLKNRTA